MCILVQKVGFLKYKSGLFHGHKMKIIWFLLPNFYLNMRRASLCPSSGGQVRVWLHMVFCTVERQPSHCAHSPTPHNHSQHNQCTTPYAVTHGLILLMMGIMMPATCWDRSLIINTGLVASCWFLSLHPTFHDARSQEHKNWNNNKNLENLA